MSHKYKFHNPDGIYFITFTVVKWVDVFTREDYHYFLIDSLRYCQLEKGLVIHAYVIMTNHLHLIVSRNREEALENIFRDFKKYTAFKLLRAIKENPSESRKRWMLEIFRQAGRQNSNNRRYQFWQNGNHPIELINNKIMDQKLDYLHNNPVKHGFVRKAEDYPWSSAADYLGQKGPVDLEMIDY